MTSRQKKDPTFLLKPVLSPVWLNKVLGFLISSKVLNVTLSTVSCSCLDMQCRDDEKLHEMQVLKTSLNTPGTWVQAAVPWQPNASRK